MELSDRDSLSVSPWLDDDQLRTLPLIEDDALSHSLTRAPLLDHDDVNALFPLLGDSSLECEGDQTLAGDPEQPPFNSDLSPIFAAKTAPLATQARHWHRASVSATAGNSGVALLTPRSKRALDLSLPSKSAAASRSARKALAPVNHDAVKSPEALRTKRLSFLTPVRGEQEAPTSSSTGGSLPKRKRTSAAKPVLVSSVWSEREQNLFFSTFKSKWPVDDRASAASAGADADTVMQAPSFSTLLLQRFDAISKRIKTKSVMEVRQFYTNVLGNLSVLLREVEHDVNLTNPDQVRIAVWCWGKLLTDDTHKNDFQGIGSADPPTKLRVAHLLLQTIIRSRRQMLKAKSFAGGVYNGVATSSAPPPTAQENASQSSVHALEAAPATPATSSASSSADTVASATPVVHHPMVRKKHTAKRKRAESDARSEDVGTLVDETPLKVRRQHAEVSFASPAPTQVQITRQRELQLQQEAPPQIPSHTPPRSSKKKMYIKMRIVPMDDAAKAHVARTGNNPKVELKLTATKKISEVAQHMAAKWIQVREIVPADALLQFHEQQQHDVSGSKCAESAAQKSGGCWTENDRTVTCFDIWKRCGKQAKNENVVVVFYTWQRPEATRVEAASATVRAADAVARSPGSLFAEEIGLADVSAAASSSLTSSSARGLQQFGENLAFHSGEFFGAVGDSSAGDKQQLATAATCPLAALLDENDDDDDAALVDCSPNTQRQRRRITPVLVSTEEFDL